MKQIAVNLFVRTAAVSLYSFLGAIIFVHLESQTVSNKNETMSVLDELSNKYNCSLKNITNEDIDALRNRILNLETDTKEWTITDGLQLSFEILTTIGYGSDPPKTDAGRVFTIFYALIGIPLFLYFLQIVGEIINKVINKTIYLVENKCLKVEEPQSIELKCLIGFATTVIIFIFWMASFLSATYKLSYLTSVYLLFITLTTIGFGDYVIKSDRIIIVSVGLCLMSGLFDAVLCYVKKKTGESRNKGRNKKCCCTRKNTGASPEEQEEYGMENKGASICSASSIENA